MAVLPMCKLVLCHTCLPQAHADDLSMRAGNIREKLLKKEVREHMRLVRKLAQIAMNGEKEDREEVVARLSCVNDLQSEHLV